MVQLKSSLLSRLQEAGKDVIVCFNHDDITSNQGEDIVSKRSRDKPKTLKSGGIEWVRQLDKEVALKSYIRNVWKYRTESRRLLSVPLDNPMLEVLDLRRDPVEAAARLRPGLLIYRCNFCGPEERGRVKILRVQIVYSDQHERISNSSNHLFILRVNDILCYKGEIWNGIYTEVGTKSPGRQYFCVKFSDDVLPGALRLGTSSELHLAKANFGLRASTTPECDP